MIKRALFPLNIHNFTKSYLESILAECVSYDELIFTFDISECEGFTGSALAQLNGLLFRHFSKPYYLLPQSLKGLSRCWHAWRILCPAFQALFLEEEAPRFQEIARSPLDTILKTLRGDRDETPLVTLKGEKKHSARRGLFITRAQPFHLGHAAIIDAMAAAEEEVIILIAKANLSHTKEHIATAGERLAMTLPHLYKQMAGRFYLVALPYHEVSLANFLELEYLLPSFQTVYVNNPQVEVLAKTAGYAIKNISVGLPISSTLIRRHMAENLPYSQYVPESTHRFLMDSEIPQRLKMLFCEEKR